jgi:CheY-like chemotaxis protein
MAMVEATPNPVLEVDREGRMLYANPAARRAPMWCDRAETIFELVAEEDRGWLMEAVADGTRLLERDITFVSLDGGRTLTVQLVPLPDHMMLLLRAPSRQDAQARAAASARREAEQLSAIAAGMAHDLNNSLNVVGAALNGPPAEPLDPALLSMARTALEGLQQVGRDLQVLARGPQRLDAARCDIMPVVERAARRLRDDALAGVRVAVHGPRAAVWAGVEADTLTRMLHALGRHAMRRLGTGHRLVLGVQLTEADVCLQVSHDGPAPEISSLRGLFEPMATQAEGHREGVGLAIVRALAIAHGGAMEANSDAGWTHMILRLPRREAATDDAVATADLLPQTILVVDDEPLVRRSLARILRRHGVEVVEAADGPSALRIVEARDDIGLALVDLVMPGMDGEQVLAALRARVPPLDVVVMSGWAREERAQACVQAGAMAFLSKPFAVDDLQRVLEASGFSRSRRGRVPPR